MNFQQNNYVFQNCFVAVSYGVWNIWKPCLNNENDP